MGKWLKSRELDKSRPFILWDLGSAKAIVEGYEEKQGLSTVKAYFEGGLEVLLMVESKRDRCKEFMKKLSMKLDAKPVDLITSEE